MRTEYGLEFQLVNEISDGWSAYDRLMAGVHLHNYGIIIIDANVGTPIDNEYDLYVIHGMMEARRQAEGGI